MSESENFAVIPKFLHARTINIAPINNIYTGFFVKFSQNLSHSHVHPIPMYMIGQFCAHYKVCDVSVVLFIHLHILHLYRIFCCAEI